MKDFTASWAEYIKNKRISSLTNENLTAKKYILISEHLKRQIFHTSVCACALGVKMKYYQEWQILRPLGVNSVAITVRAECEYVVTVGVKMQHFKPVDSNDAHSPKLISYC